MNKKYIVFLFSSLLLISSFTFLSATISPQVNLIKNDVPIKMVKLDKSTDNGIKLTALSNEIPSGNIGKYTITVNVGNRFPHKGGQCSVHYQVSKLFIKKEVTVKLKTIQLDKNLYILKGKYRIGKNSDKWSKEITLAKFKTSNSSTYDIIQQDMQNLLTIKKM
ncbi:MAG TPA: hypothetical protein QF753_10210 [Victivallales bacterium]|nr:hypothetical protein [Victivallales bacterium]